jgi:Methyltransferase domain
MPDNGGPSTHHPPERSTVDVVARLLKDRPVFHEGGKTRWDALPGTLRAIQEGVRDGDRSLETGCGASTVVFAACGAYHTAISPDSREHELVSAYCADIGVDIGRLTFIAGLSDLVLPELCTSRVLDAAFIDGAHSFPYPAVDWHYVTRALKIGGWLLMDDVPIRAVSSVYHYMRSDPSWRLEGIADHRTAQLTLVAEPAPENWTLQPFNRRPDYSFAALPTRARLTASADLGRLRRALAERYPGLRTVRRRLPALSRAR